MRRVGVLATLATFVCRNPRFACPAQHSTKATCETERLFTLRQVIDAAAEQLGVPKNLALKEKAERCYAEVSFDGFSADDVEVIDTRTATRASERRQQQQNEAPVNEAESQARATLALLRLAALAQALEELEGETVSAQDITGL